MAPLSAWPCGVEGGWDNRGAGAGLALLSISVSSLTSHFLAREGTEKHSPCSSSPTSLPQAQHTSCCWLLQGEWESGLVTPLFRVVEAAMSIPGDSSRPCTCEQPQIALG